MKQILIFFLLILLLFSCLPQNKNLPPGKDIKLIPYKEIEQTSVFRANISHIPLKTIKTIIAQDSASAGGSDGIYSGFDIDFLLLDVDGNFETKSDQFYPLEEEETRIIPGMIRNEHSSVYTPTEKRPGKLFGLNAGNGINFYIATISCPDAQYEINLDPDKCSGWLSLGDKGTLYAYFGLKNVDTYQTMYLFIGEVGIGFKEELRALIRVIE
ncbi:MAG: hypothetical protein JXJ04_26420 [Spirochaetales bacterium]|nr:hypothetical protein [Spirochaetales bacterium]